MANFGPKDVKKLREMTDAGMMDCKQALSATDGDMEAAVEWLRKKGLGAAAKKADKVAAEGSITMKIEDHKGIMVEINSQTDFVAKNEEFVGFVHDVAIQIAAMAPRYLTPEEVPAEEIESLVDDVLLQDPDHVGHGLLGLGWVDPGGVENGTPKEMDPGHIRNGEFPHVVPVTLGQVAETLLDAVDP